MQYEVVLFIVFLSCTGGWLPRSTGTSVRVLISNGGTREEVDEIVASFGFKFIREVLSTHEYVAPSQANIEELTESHPKLKIEKLNYYWRKKKAVAVSDAQWSNQWHLQTSQTPSMNVYNAWNKGFTGSGVTIAIVDDGIDVDLLSNYNSALSHDFIYDSPDPSHRYAGEGHGTNCAGVAVGVKNTLCVIGVAYEASLSAIRLLDENYAATEADDALALTHELSSIDIYSNSWGPADSGETFSGLASIQEEALQTGVTQGRGGKGVIYSWASGNGGDVYDDCNADGYASSIYTIAIAAVSETTAPTWYSEHCTAILAATYSGDSPNAQIVTTGPADSCVNDFTGTSSSCPLASGIFALTLQANSSLTWRDMQHMIVEYSISLGLDSSASFYTNGAGKRVSHWFGFGLLDAEKMVDKALIWKTVPSSTSCSSTQIDVYSSSVSVSMTSLYNATQCYINHLEHVIVTISYQASYRGDVEFFLDSPAGTQSKIFRSRAYDSSSYSITWDFMTVHNWGEDQEGQWTLTMADAYGGTRMKLYHWKIQFYGTVTDPLAGTPAAGALGGSCTNSDDCLALTDGGCLEEGKICVVCSNGHRVLNNYCTQDGWPGGYCDNDTPCVISSFECVSNVCKEKQTTEDSKTNISLIAGAVTGALVGLAFLLSACFMAYKVLCRAKATASVAPTRMHAHPQPYSSQPPAYTASSNPSQPPPYSVPKPATYSNPV